MTVFAIIMIVLFGIVAATILYAPAAVGGLGMVISTFAALPIYISTLGFGTSAGIISGGVAIITIIMFNGAVNITDVVIGPLLIVILPAVWFGHLTGLARNIQNEEDNQTRTEWYPVKKIVTRIALTAFVVTVIFGVINQYDADTIHNIVTNAYQEIMQPSQLSQAEIQNVAGQTIRIIPLFMSATMVAIFALNLWIGCIIAKKQNWMIRPREFVPDAAEVEQYTVPIFIVAAGLSFVEPVSLVAKVMLGAVGCIFFLIGLAVVHSATQHHPFKQTILTAFYIALIITMMIQPYILVLLVVSLGIAETMFKIRNKIQTQ